MNELSEYALLSDFQKSNPNIAPSLNSLRWIVRHRDQNGLNAYGAVVKRQGRIYVHTGRFAEWMRSDESLPTEIARV